MTSPIPDRMKLDRLISEIESGHIRIPQFQRDFVWKLDDTAKLLDSIIKSYPIGTFILWITTNRLASVKELGGTIFPEPHSGDSVKYVLDGQQRIASLYVVRRGKKQKREEKELNYKNIYINLDRDIDDEEPIVSIEKPENGISIYDLFNIDTIDFLENFTRPYVDKIRSHKKTFDDYEFSIIDLNDYDLDSAVEIFTRINTTGKVLTLFEIVAAKNYDETTDFNLQEKYNSFLKKLKRISYETLRPRNFLDILSLIIKNECTRKAILNLQKEEIIDKWEATVKSIEVAIDYFRSAYHIMASQLLPYDSLIVPFAYFFFKNDFKRPNIIQDKYLQEYFWNASLTFRFSSATSSKLKNDSDRIKEIIDKIRPSYDKHSTIATKDDIKALKFSTGDSICKAILCLLAKFEPKNFDNGSSVILDNSSLQRSNSRNYHHFFPKKYLYSIHKNNPNSIVNITFINEGLNKGDIRAKAPSIYMRPYESSNPDLEDTMKSHLIDNLNDYGVWKDDYDLFLEKRSERIYNEIKKRIDF